MHCRCLDSSCCRLQIEQGAAATRTGYIVSFENARTGRLQNVVTQTQRLARRFFTLHQDRIANSIAKQRTNVGGGNQKGVKKIGYPERKRPSGSERGIPWRKLSGSFHGI